MAQVYQLDSEVLLIDWLSNKVVRGLAGETLARQVPKAAEIKIIS